MKKNFKFYSIIWAVFLIAFNAIAFLVRPIIPAYEIHYDARFWIAWLFVIAAFVSNLLCARKAFRSESLEKLFYRVPLINISYTGLIVMLVLGGVLMLIPRCPAWISAIVCVAGAAFTAIAIIKADWAGDTVSTTHEKVKVQTQFIKLLTADAETLLGKAKTPDAKIATKKVYEALQYSDPMSSAALGEIEAEITEQFKAFESAINGDSDITEDGKRWASRLWLRLSAWLAPR